MQVKALVAVVCCATSLTAFSSAKADDADRVSIGDFLLNRSPATAPSTRIDYTLASEVDFDTVAGGFSYERLELRIPLSAPYRINNNHMLTLSARYEATWLNTDTFLGDMDLQDLRLRLRWMYRAPGSGWSWMGLLEPGVATDFEAVGSDDLSVNGQLGFRYGKSPTFAWIGGVIFFHNSMETRVYPGIGFQWQPHDDVLIRFAGPSLKASWQPCDDWLVHANVGSGGGTWNVENNGSSYDVKLRSYQVGVGVERRLSDKVWLGITGGVTLANDLEIESASGNRIFNDDADLGWFVKLGIRRIVW